MREYAQANKPAIFMPISSGVHQGEYTGSMWVIKQTGGTPYIQNGIMKRCSIIEPLYGYTKNYRKFKKDFSLFIWTNESSHDVVEKHLDLVKSKLNRSDIVEVINKIVPYKYVEPHLI